MPSALNKTLRIAEISDQKAVESIDDAKAKSWVESGIYVGDAVDALRHIPTNFVDLIVADPPYNMGRDFGNDSDKQTESDFAIWMKSWIALLAVCAKQTSSAYICTDWRHSGLVESSLHESGWHILNRITWKRDKGRGAKRNWKQNMEDIWFAVRDPAKYTFNLEAVKVEKKIIAPYKEYGLPKDWIEKPNGERMRMTHPSNIWTDLVVPFWSMSENTEHPTQKPEKLIERILLASSNNGDRVLDLFSGSGTTSVVAEKLGRRFLGIELNPDYVRLGMARLQRLSTAATKSTGNRTENILQP